MVSQGPSNRNFRLYPDCLALCKPKEFQLQLSLTVLRETTDNVHGRVKSLFR